MEFWNWNSGHPLYSIAGTRLSIGGIVDTHFIRGIVDTHFIRGIVDTHFIRESSGIVDTHFYPDKTRVLEKLWSFI